MTDKEQLNNFSPLSADSAKTPQAASTSPLLPVEKGRTLRQRLEQIVTRSIAIPPSEEASLTTLKEARQTLHELELYQVELETQYEELRRRQVQLDASGWFHSELYDLAAVGYVAVNKQGQILEANSITSNLLGMTQQSLINQPISRFIFESDHEVYALHQQQLNTTGEAQISELRIARQDKTVLWIRLNSTAAQKSNGDPVFRMIFTDITESKIAVEALRASEGIFRTLAESSPDHIVLYDKRCRFLY